MIWIVVAVMVILVCFGGVLLVGAPYLPTLTPQVAIALKLADLEPGQTLLELGCGDGKVLIAAAKQGIRGVGYELNPIIALIAWLRTRPYRDVITIKWGNFWSADWPASDAIFTFLLDRYMSRLDRRIMSLQQKPIRLVSFAFPIPDKKPTKVKAGVFLYHYDG